MNAVRPPYLAHAERRLTAIRALHRYRTIADSEIGDALDFASNDYLGLAREPQVVEALRRATRVGSGGARLLSGRHRQHALLEGELAAWLGRERALLFSTGYQAALGAVTTLAPLCETIYSDERNHASLIDGMRLSRTPCEIFAHGRTPARARRARGGLIVSESIFSMDGDALDVEATLGGMGDDDVLLLDEAHALGTVGSAGAGLAAGFGDPRIVVLGTLSKALGGLGGFVAGPAPFVDLMVNAARSFIFDTALPPALALAARVALMLARRDDGRRAQLHANVARLRTGLRALDLPTAETCSPIVPLVLGSEERALAIAAALEERRIFAPAIRPPTVPPGRACLRFSLRSDHTAEQIDLAVEGLRRCIVTS